MKNTQNKNERNSAQKQCNNRTENKSEATNRSESATKNKKSVKNSEF